MPTRRPPTPPSCSLAAPIVLVLLAFYGLSVEDVLQELRRREGISGIDEKKSRKAAK